MGLATHVRHGKNYKMVDMALTGMMVKGRKINLEKRLPFEEEAKKGMVVCVKRLAVFCHLRPSLSNAGHRSQGSI
ncbi:MAG TPA: hypothetical protein PKK23_02700 [Nitrospirales bacterium]|nr:hypothetical protein [Nitrospiraceae bacterium]HNP27926.1 hypothetical protein [Nitrospirales bacterium]